MQFIQSCELCLPVCSSIKFNVTKAFIDTLRILVKGGTGGMGSPKYKGVGGRGGSVYLEAQPNKKLIEIAQKYSKGQISAQSGSNSKKFQIYGEPGEDKIIPVPTGVVIYDQFMRKIGELNEKGEKLLVADGGPGGSPDSHPAYSGSKGYSQVITIDLKLIADVGLVGFPNAGKSSLLKAISRAKPKVAAYAFTTLKPNLGVLEYPDFRQITMADLPGLIEGASHNVGMGHKFLKHVERSCLLLVVVDINGFQYSPNCNYRSCLDTIILLNKELELYRKDLLDKPAILAINKMDLPGAPSTYREIEHYLNNLPSYASTLPVEMKPEKIFKFERILPISAQYDEESTNKLKNEIREVLDNYYESSLEDTMTKAERELLRKIKSQSTPVVSVMS